MPVTVRGRFRRSVHLARDFYDAAGGEGYLVTSGARAVLGRVAEALGAPVTQRAWTVTGPYGGGKSAFALFLAGLLRGDEAARHVLEDADAALASRLADVAGGPFCPVLVVGSREPLGPALLRALADALDTFAKGEENRGALAEIAAEARQLDADALDLYRRAAEAVHAATGGGLLVVVDEMGKLLEFAALHPERSDLFVLQSLAERASRAGAPLLLFTVLHQAFERYAGRLGSAQRDEWRKVQGRFEDVAFVEPVGETLRLLAAAVEATPEAVPTGAEAEARAVLAETQLPAQADREAVLDHLVGAAPVHPAVAVLVGPLFRRLAQNERSLFAFLASGERHGFLDVVSGGDLYAPAPFYRLDALYDYLVASLGATLFSERMERLWAETEAAIRALPADRPLDVALVKHAALLGFAGPLAGLRPTAETLAATTGAPLAEVEAALAGLRGARVLAYRPFGETYHVWQGSGFDLGAALDEARAHVPAGASLAGLLEQAAPPAPLVARRHSYRTGTTRAFSVVYASDADWRTAVGKPHRRTDGRVVYVLPEGEGTEAVVEAVRAEGTDPLTLVAVPEGVGPLRAAVRDLACLDWVTEHAEALRGDPVARREVAEQRAALAAEVDRRLDALLRADADGRNPCVWVRAGRAFRLSGERALQATLSAVCDEVFSDAPEVWNELLNRRKPSAAAVRGLKLLLAAMRERPDEARLGIEGTPAEFGMYASVLRATGMHRPVGGDAPPAGGASSPPPGQEGIGVVDGTGKEPAEASPHPSPLPPGGEGGSLSSPQRGDGGRGGSEVGAESASRSPHPSPLPGREGAAGAGWRFARPDPRTHSGCAAVWDRIAGLLGDAGGQPVPVSEVYAALGAPPYGVRAGLVPVFLFAFAASCADEVAFYESGTFVREMTVETVARLLKSAEKGTGTFTVQWVEVDAARAGVLAALAPVVGLAEGARKPLPVALRVLRAVHALPPYARRTGTLSEPTLDARGALERATDPTRLVFHDLPEALGAGSFLDARGADPGRVAAYRDGLRDALRELGGAYGALLGDVQDEVGAALRLRARDADGRRRELAARARAVLPAADLGLRAFLARAGDETADTRAWTESLAALLAQSPPAQWGDEDARRFRRALAETARAFDAAEPLALDLAGDAPDDAASGAVRRVRVRVKALGEAEHDGVVHVHPEDDGTVEALADRLAEALAEADVQADTQIAALGRAAARLLRARTAADPDLAEHE
jgi:hypothetical protein